MKTDLASTRGLTRSSSWRGKIARYVKRTVGGLGALAQGDRTTASRSDRRPAAPIVVVTTLGNKPFEPGLAPIWGWAYSGDDGFPEGTILAALDDEEEWLELSNRTPMEGYEKADQWNGRCGFHAALNTFALCNGRHSLRLRVKTRSGLVAAESEVSFSVNNVGPLAEITARLLRNGPNPRRFWVDLIDASDFPLEKGRAVAWFERPDAHEHVAEIVTRHGLPIAYEAHLHHFLRNGYIVLEGFIPRQDCERINQDLEALIAAGVFQYSFKGQRIEKLFEHSEAARVCGRMPGS